jgi:hypothetical protein
MGALQNYGSRSQPEEISSDVLTNEAAADCLLPMGITSENVAERFHGRCPPVHRSWMHLYTCVCMYVCHVWYVGDGLS